MTVHERPCTTIILRNECTIDGDTGKRFRRADGFHVYACAHDNGTLFCVSIRRGSSPTVLFYADDVKAVIT